MKLSKDFKFMGGFFNGLSKLSSANIATFLMVVLSIGWVAFLFHSREVRLKTVTALPKIALVDSKVKPSPSSSGSPVPKETNRVVSKLTPTPKPSVKPSPIPVESKNEEPSPSPEVNQAKVEETNKEEPSPSPQESSTPSSSAQSSSAPSSQGGLLGEVPVLNTLLGGTK